ncbi:MAG: transporter substrate-binding domain-containing protein [Aliarcobacter sp.]|nr:transporter substrate-binding domain-containing protein [Aliarcobacter sp.]
MYKLILIIFLSIINLYAQNNLRIGVLAYGTVNWELDVLKYHNLDKKYGFNLDVVNLASKNAQLVSLQAKDVNMIVNDWIWVNTQRANGKDFSFYPYSKATGTLVVNENSNINTLLDLKGKHLGIAGGVYDKTWLLFRAYGKSKYNIDLKDIVNPLFASAPILYKKMEDNSLEAAINFWHFNAKLESKNIKPLIEISECIKRIRIYKKMFLLLVGLLIRNLQMRIKN